MSFVESLRHQVYVRTDPSAYPDKFLHLVVSLVNITDI